MQRGCAVLILPALLSHSPLPMLRAVLHKETHQLKGCDIWTQMPRSDLSAATGEITAPLFAFRSGIV